MSENKLVVYLIALSLSRYYLPIEFSIICQSRHLSAGLDGQLPSRSLVHLSLCLSQHPSYYCPPLPTSPTPSPQSSVPSPIPFSASKHLVISTLQTDYKHETWNCLKPLGDMVQRWMVSCIHWDQHQRARMLWRVAISTEYFVRPSLRSPIRWYNDPIVDSILGQQHLSLYRKTSALDSNIS